MIQGTEGGKEEGDLLLESVNVASVCIALGRAPRGHSYDGVSNPLAGVSGVSSIQKISSPMIVMNK